MTLGVGSAGFLGISDIPEPSSDAGLLGPWAVRCPPPEDTCGPCDHQAASAPAAWRKARLCSHLVSLFRNGAPWRGIHFLLV